MEVAWDPFARNGLTRTRIGPGSCAWCGTHKKKIYTYQNSDDFRRFGKADKLKGFCNLECYKDYAK